VLTARIRLLRSATGTENAKTQRLILFLLFITLNIVNYRKTQVENDGLKLETGFWLGIILFYPCPSRTLVLRFDYPAISSSSYPSPLILRSTMMTATIIDGVSDKFQTEAYN
jgi:hypothetical protein